MEIRPPVRARRSYRQHLPAPADRVFPQLCPVLEVDWVEGWHPRLVLTRSGVAEDGCVFTTPVEGGGEAIWIVTRHEPDRGRIAFVKTIPGVTVTRIDIRVVDGEDEGTSTADVTYEHTALGPEGEAVVAAFTEEAWRAFMERWERDLGEYLTR